MKPRIFFRFSGKYIILCILKGEMLFKMHKIIVFFQSREGSDESVHLRILAGALVA